MGIEYKHSQNLHTLAGPQAALPVIFGDSKPSMECSVIICTHNPRQDYLRRVLDALKAQTLSKGRWELLLIDDVSKEPLAGKWDLSWHPNARHIREEELGLTPARLRGIKESKGGLLVFVDDDNVLEVNYLEKALDIADGQPFMGIWSGSIRGEFETEPSPWMRPYLKSLAIREVSRDICANYATAIDAEPYGAGLCVRRNLAQDYMNEVAKSPLRRSLGRRG